MKNRQIFIVIIIINLIFAFVTGGKTFYNTSIFLLIILASNYLLVSNNIKKIDSNFIINKEVHVVGEEIKFNYILVNKSIIPIYKSSINLILSKEFGNIDVPGENFSFKPNQIISLKSKFECKKRGYYDIGKLDVQIKDLFDFYTKNRRLDKSINIKVYPKLIEVNKLKNSLSGFLGSQRSNKSSFDDFTNIKTIRKYQVGDNPKNIHFKLSAKGEDTFVKTYYDTNYLNVIILVNGVYEEDEKSISEEKCVSISLSIAKYILENLGQVQYLLSNKSNLNLKLKDIREFSNLIENVINSPFDGYVSFENYLGNVLNNIEKTSECILVTSKFDGFMLDKIIFFRKKEINLMLFLVDIEKSELNSDLLIGLEINNISVYYIKNIEEL